MLLVVCSPVICQSTKDNPPKTPQDKPGKQSSEKGPQKAPDDVKVDPVFFDLKEMLYFDKKLKECVKEIPESYKLRSESLRNNPELKSSGLLTEGHERIAEAASLVQNGDPKKAEKSLESITDEKLKQGIDYWMVLAYAKQQAGDLVGARNSMRQIFTLPQVETGIRLLTWNLLRELGDKPEEPIANEVLGVVVEVGMANTVAVVAGFADGMSRLWFVTGGGGTIGGVDSFPKETVIAAKDLVRAGQPLVGEFPLEKERQLPKQGRIRFALLTAGGIHVKEESIDLLEKGRSPLLYSVNSAAHKLFTLLLKFNFEKSKVQ